MAFEVPWLSQKRDETENLNPRDHNSKEENELLDEAEERFELSKANKQDANGERLHSKWRDMDKLYRSDQWQGPVPKHRSKPVLNIAFAFIEAVVPRLTDNRPEVLILPRRSPHDTGLADQLQHGQEYLWYINKVQREIEEAVRMSMKYGTSLLKTVWDPEKFDGLGEVIYRAVHPRNFFPDPRAYRIQDMEYCITSTPKPLEYFARRWPEKGHLVTETADWADTEHGGPSTGGLMEKQAPLVEYMFYDEEARLCVMYYANGVVLDVIGGDYDDTGEPVFRHNQFPYTKMVDYPLDKEFWAMGELEIIESIQRLINAFEAQIIDNTRLMSNVQWHVNKRLSGMTEEDAHMVNDIPGNVLFSADGGIEKIPGEAIPAHIPQHLNFLIEAAEYILGIHDVVQGRRPEGVRAASALIALQEAASIRIRQKASHLNHALTEMVEQGNWLMLEYYDEPRNIRITGTNEFTTLNVREALMERAMDRAIDAGMMEGMEQTGIDPRQIDPNQLEGETQDMLLDRVKFPDFDVEVNVGPSVPYSQAMIHEQAKEFYQMGAIDEQALLEATRFPNWEEILNRMQGMQEQMGGEGAMERMGEATYGPEGPPPGR